MVIVNVMLISLKELERLHSGYPFAYIISSENIYGLGTYFVNYETKLANTTICFN